LFEKPTLPEIAHARRNAKRPLSLNEQLLLQSLQFLGLTTCATSFVAAISWLIDGYKIEERWHRIGTSI